MKGFYIDAISMLSISCDSNNSHECTKLYTFIEKCVHWMYVFVYILWKMFIQNEHSSKKVYVEYIELCTFFWKIVYVKCTKLYTFFKRLCTLNVQNCLDYLKNMYIESTKLGILFEKLYTLNIQHCVHSLKNVYVEHTELCT